MPPTNNNQELQQLKRQIEELEKWKKKTEETLRVHQHQGNDDTLALRSTKIRLNEKEVIGHGNASQLTQTVSTVGATPSRTHNWILSLGDETPDNQGGSESSLNTQLWLRDFPLNTSNHSFLLAYRKPLYVLPTGKTVSVTSGDNELEDTSKGWETDELAGAYVSVYDESVPTNFVTRQIASNTSDTITIDGTWPSDITGVYLVFMPVFLGSADTPWRQLYTGGEDVSASGDGSVRRAIRIGYGTTASSIGIYYGTGSPEGAVTAIIGSLYLRLDGSTSTTLYVKTANTDATGWSAK